MLAHTPQLPSVAASRCAGRAPAPGRKLAMWGRPPHPAARPFARVRAQTPEQLRAEYERLHASDPAAAEAMRRQAEAYQKALSTPEAQREMQQMSEFLANPALKEKLATLQSDPEFADFFEALKTQGPAAIAKYWSDEAFLDKIGRRLADAMPAATPRPPPPPPQQPPEEVTNLLEAARWGDVEAVEDFIAIGKDVNQADKEGRRPLHFAVAFGKGEAGAEVLAALLAAKGIELNATDVKRNTALHYAAGYGRGEYAAALLDAGADGAAQNDTGKTAADLARLSPQNPLAKDAALMARLDKAAGFFRDV